jgi:preprotein translocase subunit SecF
MKQTSGTAASKAAASQRAAGPVAPPHFTELISPNPGIDFLRWAPIAIAATWLFILAGLASVWWHGGLNYGIDFAGGTLVQVRFAEPARSTTCASLSQHDLKGPRQDVGGSGRGSESA